MMAKGAGFSDNKPASKDDDFSREIAIPSQAISL